VDIREMEAGREFGKELIKLWKICETKQLGKVFKYYMESMGVKKWDSKRKDNLNTYLIDGKSTGWNRAQCYFYKDSANYAENNLGIILRKKSGSYLIIEKQGRRAFEVDYHGVLHYDKKLLDEIIEEHAILFSALLAIDNKIGSD
jgi:hypothetical protein